MPMNTQTQKGPGALKGLMSTLKQGIAKRRQGTMGSSTRTPATSTQAAMGKKNISPGSQSQGLGSPQQQSQTGRAGVLGMMTEKLEGGMTRNKSLNELKARKKNIPVTMSRGI